MDFWKLLELVGQQYPALIPLLSKPGVFEVVSQAIADNWPATRLQAALEATPYFQSTPQASRTFDVLNATDPATAKQRVQESDLIVRRVQAQLGVMLDPTDALLLSLNATAQGWDENRIKMEVVAMANGSQQPQAGVIGDTMTQLNGLADQYGVPINHNDLYWWGANIAAGNQTQEGFRQYVNNQAINLYPALKPALENGMTVKQYAAPYFQLAANELGINPNAIDLRNPAWMDLVIGSDDKGNQGVNSLQEALVKLRTDPKYNYDAGTPAVTEASSLASMLQSKFGIAA